MSSKFLCCLFLFALAAAGQSGSGDKTLPEFESPRYKPSNQSKLGYQKPGAPIRIASPDFIQLDPNSSQDVIITFQAPKRGSLVLRVKNKEGIEFKTQTSEKRFNLSKETVSFNGEVIATNAGQYHIMFEAEYSFGKQPSKRVIGIPVYVGEPAKTQMKPHPKKIIMPAKETIRKN